jgi:hypothetical protein
MERTSYAVVAGALWEGETHYSPVTTQTHTTNVISDKALESFVQRVTSYSISNIILCLIYVCGSQDSSAGIVIGYGLDGQGIRV